MKITQDQFEELVDSIMSIGVEFHDNPNGPYESICPMCEAYKTYKGNEKTPGMGDIKHTSDCPRNIIRKITNPEEFI